MQALAESPKEFAEKARQSFGNTVIEPTKNISKGSIVTIDGKEYELQGDAVPVAPVTELIQGKQYLIKYSGKLCHVRGIIDEDEFEGNQVEVIFVGEITLRNKMKRNIFYNQDRQGTYFMFSTELNYIVKRIRYLRWWWFQGTSAE